MSRAGGWVLACALAVAPVALAQVPAEEPAVVAELVSITLDDYHRTLRALHHQLRRGELAGARDTAQWLLACRPEWEGGELAVDSSVLQPVLAADNALAARLAAQRLQPLVAALDELRGAPAADPTDPQLLDELRRQQEVTAVAAGGDVAELEVEPPGFFKRAIDAVVQGMVWLWLQLERLIEWLADLWPEDGKARGTGLDSRLVTALVVLAAVLLVGMAVRWRRQQGSGAEQAADSVPAPLAAVAEDTDPLSREADEWQHYARQLEAEGRRREAVRAWYHAVLVTLYRAGLLHYRRGRTNWEYVSALGPDLAWRRDFVDLTRSFESEWYGRRQTQPEALAACAAAAQAILEEIYQSRRRAA